MFENPSPRGICVQDVVPAIHNECWVRFCATEKQLNRVTHVLQCWSVEWCFVINRREACSLEQSVAIAQGDFERLRKREYHLSARICPTCF